VKYGAGTMDMVGPPFPADHRVYGPAHWDAPAHFHRFALSAASTGQGCDQVILGLEKQWIQITDTSGGESFVLGPHVKIRVTSSCFDIVERPRHPPPPPKYWIEHYYYENSVRTCSGWAPRG
jgi:hypothetical protein